MSNENNQHAAELRRQFARFFKSDWRKQSRWSIKASEVRLLMAIKEGAKEGTREADSGGITVSYLSKILGVTSPTVTQMINSLIHHEYVIRSARPADRRISEISLTEKGEQVAREANEYFQRLFEGLIGHLGKERSMLLAELLDQSANYFKQAVKEDNN